LALACFDVAAEGVVSAPPVVAMRNTWPGLGTSSSLIPGTRCAAQHHAHFLQHVAVVVDPGFVETDRSVD